MKQGILRVFINADLRAGHDGLSQLAKENGIKTSEIEPGSFLVFINTGKNKLKVYASNQVIAYLKLPNGKINMNTIRELPKVFNGRSINYSEALKMAVEKQMREKGRTIRVV